MPDNNIIEKDLGPVSAWAIAKANGFDGTEAEWEALQANAAQNGSDAEAFAKGTRNGEAVASDDPAYHNNCAYHHAGTSADADTCTTKAAEATAAAATASAAYNVNLLAPNYSAESTYAVGDHVIYNGGYYECISAISTAEAWTAAHWRQLTVGGESADLKSAITSDIKKTNEQITKYGKAILPLEWEPGQIKDDGAEQDSTVNSRTDFIPIPAENSYAYSGSTSVVYMYRYDANKQFVSKMTISANSSQRIGAWSNTSYIRLVTSNGAINDVYITLPKSVALLTDVATAKSEAIEQSGIITDDKIFPVIQRTDSIIDEGRGTILLAWESGQIDDYGEEQPSTANSRTDFIQLPAPGSRVYSGTSTLYLFRYNSSKEFVSKMTVAGNSYQNIGEWSNTSYLRFYTGNESIKKVVLTLPKTLAMLTDLSKNAPYIVEPAVGNALTFTVDSSYNIVVGLKTSSNNALIVIKPDNTVYVKTVSSLSFPYTVPNYSALVYSASADSLIIVDMENPQAITGDYTILLANQYGTIKGEWYKFYLSNIVGNPSKLPQYYYDNDYLPNKIAEIVSANNMSNGISFAFLTDLHFQANNKNSKFLCKEIIDNTTVPYVIFGGDYVRAYGTESELISDANDFLSYVNYIGKDKCFGVRGNHDFTIKTNSGSTTGAPNTGYTAPEGFAYNYIMKTQERYAKFDDAPAMYGYLDIPNQKTRIFLVNSCTTQGSDTTASWDVYMTVGQDQIDFILENIDNLYGWNIVFVSHITPDNTLGGYDPHMRVIQEIASAINNKTSVSYSYDGVSVSKNFSNTTNKCICCISGHNHTDGSHVENGFLSILTTCDARYTDDGEGAVSGTITEQAIDVYFIDYDAGKVKTVRVGRGENRSWNIP